MSREKKRYLLISPHYPPPFIGGHMVWVHSLLEFSTNEFDILTCSLPPGEREIIQGSHRFIRKKWLFGTQHRDENPSAFDLAITYGYILIWFFFACITRRYSAVLADTFIFENGLLFLMGRIFNVPVVGMAVGEEFTITLMRKGFKSAIRKFFLKYLHRMASGFVVVCDMCKDILASFGVDPKTIYVLPPSVNPQKIIPRDPQKKPGRRILSVGRLVERKGFHVLIDAVAIVKKEIPDVSCTIVGGGPFLPVIMEKISFHRLQSSVFIKGTLTDRELAREYRDADLFVLAHRLMEDGNTEGCPVVFAEAGAIGLPVIGGMGGGSSTIIHDGENGYIVNMKNTHELARRIRQLLLDPLLSEKMGNAAIENIRLNHNPVKLGGHFSSIMKKFAGEAP